MPTNIQVTPNGPLKVEGDFVIHKADGSPDTHKGMTVFLCRCGHSNTKPFCDGSHKAAEFNAE